MDNQSMLNLYQCNNNSEYSIRVCSPFYDLPSDITTNVQKNFEHTSNSIQLGSSNDKENVPTNSQYYNLQVNSPYRNEITSTDEECNFQENKFQQFPLNEPENNIFGSQGQVLSPFLGFENNNCNQFSQPPILSPFPSYCPENNQIIYSQPPVLSPFVEYSQPQVLSSFTKLPSGSVKCCHNQQNIEPVSQYVNSFNENTTLENSSNNRQNSVSNFEFNSVTVIKNINFVSEDNQTLVNNFQSELVPETNLNECDYFKINSNHVSNVCISEIDNLDISENQIIFETPIKQVHENLNYDLLLPLNPERKDDKLAILRYLNESQQSLENQNLNCSMNILKTPVKNLINDNVISPVLKTILKPKTQPNSMNKAISFHPSTSIISNTGEETPSKYNSSFSKGNPNTSSDFSPELFSDEDVTDDNNYMQQNYVPSEEENVISKVSSMNIRNKQDKLLLKKLQESFIGILPPPSVTICQLNSEDILNKYNQNKDIFSVQCHNKEIECSKSNRKSMLINCDLNAAKDSCFPEITTKRYHGLHYNRSKISEDIEQLCQKYSERFVGCETASSCTVWQINLPSSASKRRMIRKQQTCKSPGRRLSHLARRRITFSKENLNAKNSVLPSITMNNNQRMIGVKKSDILMKKRLSPNKKMISPRKRMLVSPRKRKTPNKRSPQKLIRTPSSSSRKNRQNTLSTEKMLTNRTLSSKRALFQSPDKPSTSNIKRKLFSKIDKADEINSKKRKRDLDDDLTPQREKMLRSFSSNDVILNKVKTSSTTLNRRHSETVTSYSSGDFSEHHTKKMLWAISTALRTQNIGMSHPNFKTYASILSQICKRLLSDLLPGQIRLPGSVNERMSKIAHQHVYAVVKGKTVDEIIEEVKSKSMLLSQKPKGYIAPDNFDLDNNSKNSFLKTTETISTDHLVNKNNQLDKSRIRRQIIFDKL